MGCCHTQTKVSGVESSNKKQGNRSEGKKPDDCGKMSGKTLVSIPLKNRPYACEVFKFKKMVGDSTLSVCSLLLMAFSKLLQRQAMGYCLLASIFPSCF